MQISVQRPTQAEAQHLGTTPLAAMTDTSGAFETAEQRSPIPTSLGEGFNGDLADFSAYDASSNLLEQCYLNEHTDTAAAGLDGLVVIGRKGSIGTYVDCAAVIQEGFDSDLAGLGAYGIALV